MTSHCLIPVGAYFLSNSQARLPENAFHGTWYDNLMLTYNQQYISSELQNIPKQYMAVLVCYRYYYSSVHINVIKKSGIRKYL